MGDNNRYYWIKLKTDFFNQQTIDFLLSQKNGCEYIVLYQMLCLNTANNNGEMCSKIGEMIVPYNVEKIVRDTKYFDFDTVTIALGLFKQLGLIYEEKDKILKITNFNEMVGSETSSAKRVREYRERQEAKKSLPSITKTNAERQRAFRAKQACEGKQHIPFIEDYQNKKRYGGNYYIVMKRDCFKCKICGSIENLCVHHIAGFNELKPENNAENKMIVTCRDCHSKIHAGTPIPNDVLDSIDYYSNESNDFCNNDVTQEIEYRDKSIDIDIDKENNKRKNFIKPTLEEVNQYCLERKNNIDPENFIDYYNSNGWKVGKNQMKDWKAAIRTWERRNKEVNNAINKGSNAKSRDGSEYAEYD